MFGPLSGLAAGRASPACWARPESIAEFLESSLSQAPGVEAGPWLVATTAAAQELEAAAAEERRPLPQRVLSRSLYLSLFPDVFPSLLRRRLLSWLPLESVPSAPELENRWGALRVLLARTPPSWAWAHIKTLAGAWTTSARIPSAPACSCLFGCSDPDAFPHYLVCPRLLHLLALPRGFLPVSPLTRLGLGAEPDNETEYPRLR
eukprot:5580167-Pyramimonas_sp.AAC.1